MKFVKRKKIFDGKQFKRIEFSAVRKEDILSAINNPRALNQNLVHAAITRRFLDRFFGYKISPISIRRTKFGKSAGRVQSPTLKILCEKEREIDLFEPKEYWDFNIELEDIKKNKLKCSIVSDEGKRFDKLSINNKKLAEELKKRYLMKNFLLIISIKEKKKKPLFPIFKFTSSSGRIIKTWFQSQTNKFYSSRIKGRSWIFGSINNLP